MWLHYGAAAPRTADVPAAPLRALCRPEWLRRPEAATISQA